MKKVYLDKLPKKYGIGANRNKLTIDWKNSVGYEINFIYNDIKDKIKVVDYDSKKQNLLIVYKNNKYNIKTKDLINCKLGVVTGKVNRIYEYKYNIGSIINGLEILETIRVKMGDQTERGYRVRCIKDGYIHNKTEKGLIYGRCCPVCCNQKIIKGLNDIATTHPHLCEYFVDIEDTYKYSYGSNKKVLIKCPDCGFEKNMCISDLTTNGISCPKCSDGKSYPEKFVFSLLEQLGVDFTTEKVFKWSENKRYDFYLSNINCIVETHGMQHYNDGFAYISKNAKSLKEEQENDKLKKQFAIENNIKHYIVLDCKKSNTEYIKNSILSSELNKIFDLSKIDWLKCHEFGCNSRVKEACDLWNSGIKNTINISKIMKLGSRAIGNYLKQGKIIGWCDYDPKETRIKTNRENAKKNQELLGKRCKITVNGKDVVYSSISECLEKNEFSQKIFDKLVKSKEPFKPNPRYHKHLMHLEGMRIEYI